MSEHVGQRYLDGSDEQTSQDPGILSAKARQKVIKRRSTTSLSHLASQSRESVADKRGSRLAQAYLESSRAKIEEARTLLVPQANNGPASLLPKTDGSCLGPLCSGSSDATSEIQPVLII